MDLDPVGTEVAMCIGEQFGTYIFEVLCFSDRFAYIADVTF